MSCRAPIRGAFYERRNNFGSLAKFSPPCYDASSRVREMIDLDQSANLLNGPQFPVWMNQYLPRRRRSSELAVIEKTARALLRFLVVASSSMDAAENKMDSSDHWRVWPSPCKY